MWGRACGYGLFSMPSASLAHDDVPLVMVNLGPELQPSTSGLIDSINAGSLVIEAYVDANGRCRTTAFLSDPGALGVGAAAGEAHADLHDIPSCAVEGRPMPSWAVLSFSRIRVRR